MRVAHLIIVHKGPTQVLRLLQRLQHPSFDLFVHVDGKVAIEHFKSLKNEADFMFIKNRVACHWGGNSVLTSILNSVQEILNSGEKYDFVNVISGQDYPLMSPEKMLAFFNANRKTNFISFDDSPHSEWWKLARDRYEKYHFTDLNFKGKYMLQKIANTILPKRKFPHYTTLYGGTKSSWWTVTSDCASYIVNTLEENPRLKRFLKYVWCTDEFVVATIIMNSHFKDRTVNDNLRYIDWSEQNPSPKTLTINDLNKISASRMMFARKFDVEVDTSVLDILDQNLY
ncbi:glycosyl transferase [Pedobacter quisquiliarum]|uniref:Peptide O-xylosyltransferase n=1 Tax=Pedobacter quisquiliarum TaxID=1834438 RepID=A0A916XED0_9SPHI|nr:beta-1,6-N-acetylglucosaminyltransferase [Pedobacter quisquiliarum]GGC67748.1 glycosyl transferase [Pedobacter quisquiliarum]